MADRYQLPDGRIVEALPGGGYKVVSGGASPSSAIGPAIGGNPLLPGQQTKQGLDIRGAELGNQKDAVTLPYAAPTAQANLQGQGLSNERTAQGIGLDRVKEITSQQQNFEKSAPVLAYKNSLPTLASAMRAPKGRQGDLDVIYAFGKVMDPNSAVRGEELDMANSTGSLAQQMKSYLAKVDKDGGLDPEVRANLINTMRNRVAQYNVSYSSARDNAVALAKEGGFNPDLIVGKSHFGDSFAKTEHQWMRDNGFETSGDLSQKASGLPSGIAPVRPGEKSQVRYNPQASAYLDSLIRKGVPYASAAKEMQDRFGQVLPDPRIYNEALKYARDPKNKGYKGSYGYAEDTKPLSAVEQVRNSIAQSTAGASTGLFANALAGGVPQLLAGDQGTYAVGTMRDSAGAVGMGAEALGFGLGAVGGDALVARGAGAMGRFGAPLLNNPGVRTAAVDIGLGGMFGANTNPDNRLAGAAIGAGGAAVGNGIGRTVIGPGVAALGSTNVGGALGRLINEGAAVPARLTGGQRLLSGELNRVDLGRVTGNLDDAARLNLPYAPADADPALRALGGSAARKSPDMLRLADTTFRPRALGQSERAIGAIDQHLAPVGDLPTIQQGARTRAQNASRPHYQQAMAQPAPEDAALSEILRRPGVERGAREAYNIALNEGVSPAELSFVQGANGEQIINANPNWRTLQFVKRGLDAEVEKMRNPLTGQLDLQNPSIAALDRARTDLNGRMGALNPDYARGNAEYANFIGQGEAAARGAQATRPGVTPEAANRAVNGLNPQQQPFFQQGYASDMADNIGRMNRRGNPYEAVAGSPDQQAKIGAIFPQGADNFARIAQLEGDMGRTFNETLGGSPTQPRQQADQAFDAAAGNNLETAADLMTGNVVAPLLRRGAQAIGNARQVRVGRAAADEIGPILFNTNPAATSQALRDLMDLRNARTAYEGRARRVGGMFGAPAAPALLNYLGQ